MGMLEKMEQIEFNEKRLYIFYGFDDYPIATLDAAKNTRFLKNLNGFFHSFECLLERFALPIQTGLGCVIKLHNKLLINNDLHKSPTIVPNKKTKKIFSPHKGNIRSMIWLLLFSGFFKVLVWVAPVS